MISEHENGIDLQSDPVRTPGIRVNLLRFVAIFIVTIAIDWKERSFQDNIAVAFLSAVGWIAVFLVWDQIDKYLFQRHKEKS
jgi:hypothetical protein